VIVDSQNLGGENMVGVHKSRNGKDEQAANAFLNLTTLNSREAQAIESSRLDFRNTVALSDS
jgi:hypothetical protein